MTERPKINVIYQDAPKSPVVCLVILRELVGLVNDVMRIGWSAVGGRRDLVELFESKIKFTEDVLSKIEADWWRWIR